MLALESDVAPHRPEKSAQHETKRFGIFDLGPTAYEEKPFGDFLSQRFIFDMLHAQTRERFLPFLAINGVLAEGWIDNCFFKGVRHPQGRKKRLRHPQALIPVDKAGQAVSNRFKC